jgi:PTS system nitrogen regulatory IIA component
LIERRITFVLPEDGISGWKINRLKTLSTMFRSVVILRNITCWEHANVEQPLRILSLAGKQDDLCQLQIEGSDAELACMVLMDFVADHFILVNTSHRSTRHANPSLQNGLTTFQLPFDFDYHFSFAEQGEKASIIKQVARLTTQDRQAEIEQCLLSREQHSPTAIGKQIALPHILTNEVKTATLTVIKCRDPVDWHSPKLGPITLVIAPILPASLDRSLLLSFTHLTKSLVSEEFCQLLTSSRAPEALKAILIHQLVKGQRSQPL